MKRVASYMPAVLIVLAIAGLLVGAAFLCWTLIESIDNWIPRREM